MKRDAWVNNSFKKPEMWWELTCLKCNAVMRKRGYKPSTVKPFKCVECLKMDLGKNILKHPEKQFIEDLIDEGVSDKEISQRVRRRDSKTINHIPEFWIRGYREVFYKNE